MIALDNRHQTFFSSTDVTLHSVERDVQNVGDLIILHVIKIVQCQGNSVIVIQLHDRLTYFTPHFSKHQRIERINVSIVINDVEDRVWCIICR